MDNGVFEWIVRPYARDWRKTILLLAVIVLVCVLVYFSFRNVLMVALAILFLGTNLINFFLPSRYIFDKDTIRVITPLGQKARQWTVFKSFYPDPNGVLLSPFPRKSWMENFRGLYLMWGDKREQVLEIIKNNIKSVAK